MCSVSNGETGLASTSSYVETYMDCKFIQYIFLMIYNECHNTITSYYSNYNHSTYINAIYTFKYNK